MKKTSYTHAKSHIIFMNGINGWMRGAHQPNAKKTHISLHKQKNTNQITKKKLFICYRPCINDGNLNGPFIGQLEICSAQHIKVLKYPSKYSTTWKEFVSVRLQFNSSDSIKKVKLTKYVMFDWEKKQQPTNLWRIRYSKFIWLILIGNIYTKTRKKRYDRRQKKN